jgi:hypothetical protein
MLPVLTGQPGLHSPCGLCITVGLLPADPAALTASRSLLSQPSYLCLPDFRHGEFHLGLRLDFLRRLQLLRPAIGWCLSRCKTCALLRSPAPPGLSTCFAFQTSFRLRSSRPAATEVTRRYMPCASKTVLSAIFHRPAFAGGCNLTDNRVDKIGRCLRYG